MATQATINKNGKMAVGPPARNASPKHVRRAHLVKNSSTQLFMRTTRAKYQDLPPALKAEILSLTEAKIARLKKDLGDDFGFAPTAAASNAAASSSASKTSPERLRKRQHEKFIPSKNTPHNLTPSRRDGKSSSFAFDLGDSPVPGPSYIA